MLLQERIQNFSKKCFIIKGDFLIFPLFYLIFKKRKETRLEKIFPQFLHSDFDNIIYFHWFYLLQKSASQIEILNFIERCGKEIDGSSSASGMQRLQLNILSLSLIIMSNHESKDFQSYFQKFPNSTARNYANLTDKKSLIQTLSNNKLAFPVFGLIFQAIDYLKNSGLSYEAEKTQKLLSESCGNLIQKVLENDIWLNKQWFTRIGHMNVLPYFVYANNLQGKKIFIESNEIVEISNKFFLKIIKDQMKIILERKNKSNGFTFYNQSNVLYPTHRGIFAGFNLEKEISSGGFKLEKPDGYLDFKKAFLQKIGKDDGSLIVTINTRSRNLSSGSTNELRSVDPSTYIKGIQYLTSKGYIVIRLGDNSQEELPPVDGFFDYSSSDLKSEICDILLICSAEFHIGSSSGISLVPLTFGVPTLMLNWFPRRDVPWGRKTHTIYKKIFDHQNHVEVKDDKNLYEIGNITSKKILGSLGLMVHSLSEEEILFQIKKFESSVMSFDGMM